MGRTVVLVILLRCLISWGGAESRGFADEPAKPAHSLAEIEHWIEQLSAPEFSKREEATKQLIAAGTTAAVKPLMEASQSSSLEATVRITAVLRSWFTSDRDELYEQAESALEQLSQSQNRYMAGRAVAVLDQYAGTLRHERALAQIRKFGATVKDLEIRNIGLGPDTTKDFMIVLGRDWRGGEDGLKHIRRLTGIQTLYFLHNPATKKIVTPGISREAIDDLQRSMPQLPIQYRGPAFLGVSPMNGLALCRVRTVSPDSPAAKAKLMPGDFITQFEGKPVRSFDELIDLIALKQPGDVVKLEILRGDEDDLHAIERLQALKAPPDPAKELLDELRKRLTKEVEVTLGEWK